MTTTDHTHNVQPVAQTQPLDTLLQNVKYQTKPSHVDRTPAVHRMAQQNNNKDNCPHLAGLIHTADSDAPNYAPAQ